ncbi:hypothetical protein HYH03_011643 [Edaphochlamys debaryana]|uniref:Uncharacterized protein n=1 Tax=Edaphochlamys debaryana TaxID=47281 RepID=A0A835XU94_9CHLO|nr:hypothetical protein HYH03_011643 [Edaphochlamys debaryana]|eukprot:KAG2489840.1 hypothetical protein HYH03_011643 [Edaphochlamys debaryana]
MSNLLLSRAKLLHPGLEEGPWADDMEAVVGVLCGADTAGPSASGTAAACTVVLEGVTMRDNTGVATSGLYVLCDGTGAASCRVTLKDCSIEGNRLLWQPAIDPANLPPPGLFAPLTDWDTLASGTSAYDNPGPGLQLFRAMMPWLTFTYSLIDYWAGLTAKQAISRMLDLGLEKHLGRLPRVTGRTLGGVVLHQRNAPWPGVGVGGPALMDVDISGGSFVGNDGSAIMSTATDWSSMAGGNGTWAPTDPLRHSAAFTLRDVTLRDHVSGAPAVWLRWPMRVTVTNCTATNSSGAMWLDQVRDDATLEGCSFVGGY